MPFTLSCPLVYIAGTALHCCFALCWGTYLWSPAGSAEERTVLEKAEQYGCQRQRVEPPPADMELILPALEVRVGDDFELILPWR